MRDTREAIPKLQAHPLRVWLHSVLCRISGPLSIAPSACRRSGAILLHLDVAIRVSVDIDLVLPSASRPLTPDALPYRPRSTTTTVLVPDAAP